MLVQESEAARIATLSGNEDHMTNWTANVAAECDNVALMDLNAILSETP